MSVLAESFVARLRTCPACSRPHEARFVFPAVVTLAWLDDQIRELRRTEDAERCECVACGCEDTHTENVRTIDQAIAQLRAVVGPSERVQIASGPPTAQSHARRPHGSGDATVGRLGRS